jgi:hypothetical protein
MASTNRAIRRRARMRRTRNPKLFGLKQAIQRKRMQQRIENAKSLPDRNSNGKIIAPNGQQGNRRRRRFNVGMPKNRNYAQRGLAAKQAYGLVPVNLVDNDGDN